MENYFFLKNYFTSEGAIACSPLLVTKIYLFTALAAKQAEKYIYK